MKLIKLLISVGVLLLSAKGNSARYDVGQQEWEDLDIGRAFMAVARYGP